MDFSKYPQHNPYRVLVDRTPMQRGFDVYALQCALNEVLGITLKTDGTLGPKTGKAIWDAQRKLALKPIDGKAGQITQRALAFTLLAENAAGTMYLLGKGQVEHESSALLGNYSAQRPEGDFDAGIVQMNSAHHSVAEAFNPVQALALYAAKTQAAYDAYSDRSRFVGEDFTEDRRYALAAGHWNAPAYANWLAGLTHDTAKPGPTARSLLEEYMADCTVYM